MNHKGSHAFKQLDEILDSRHQPWCRYGKGSWPADEPAELYENAEIRSTIKELAKEELPRALIRACVHGDLWIAKTIWSARGPFEIEFTKKVFWTVVGGTQMNLETSANHIFTNAASIQEVEQIMEWMPTVGLGFLIGAGSEHAVMLESTDLEIPITALARSQSFAGDLPSLSHGLLSSPELLTALSDKAQGSTFPDLFQNVLCWVSDRMLDEFSGELRPFEISHGLTLYQAGDDLESIKLKHRFEDCLAPVLDTIQYSYMEAGQRKVSPGEWEPYQLSVQTTPCNGGDDESMNMHLVHQASAAIQYGFWSKPGFTLCLAPASFLSGFEQGSVDADNYRRAQAFADQYFPLDLLGHANGECISSVPSLKGRVGCVVDFVHGAKNNSFRELDRLYCQFGDASNVSTEMKSLIPKALIEFLLKENWSRDVSAKSMMALQQGFGLDNEGLSMKPDHRDLQALLDAGFRFSSETRCVLPNIKAGGKMIPFRREDSRDTAVLMNLYGLRVDVERCRPTPEDIRALDESYRNAIKLGLWPSSQQRSRPKSLSAALDAITKKPLTSDNQDQALLAYLQIAGAEECAKAVSSSQQWDFLCKQFGEPVMKPHLKLASREARGQILEDDLGM